MGRIRTRVGVAAVLAVAVGAAVMPSQSGSAGSAGAESGEPVIAAEELVEERSRFAKTFSTAEPGVFRTEVYDAPVHVQREDGWREIDTTLVPAGDGTLVAAEPDTEVRIAEQTSDAALFSVRFDPAASVAIGQGSTADAASAEQTSPGGSVPSPVSPGAAVEVGPDGSLVGGDAMADGVAAAVSESSARFEELAPGAALELSARPDGIKGTLVLDSGEAPDTFAFPLDLEGLSAAVNEWGHVALSRPDSTPVGLIPRGWMQDSAGDGWGERSDGVTYEVSDTAAGPVLVIRLDQAWLAAPERVFPVVVDPTVTNVAGSASGAYDDTYVRSGTTVDRSNDNGLQVGKASGAQNRSFLRFDLSAIAGKEVLAAELGIYQLNSASCTPSDVEIYRVTEAWPSPLTTYGGPSIGELIASEPASFGRTGCPAATVTADLTDAAQRWADGSWANHGVSLRAADENDTSQFKVFLSSETWVPPVLEVTWSEPAADEYVYDEPGRLAAAIDRNGDAAVYSYDAIGNILAVDRYPVTDLSVIHVGPGSGEIGDQVTVYGTGFSETPGSNTVEFNGTGATVTAATPTRLTVTVPSGATTGTVEVTVGAGSATSPKPWTKVAPPTISSLSASVGVAGDSITINGTGFDTTPERNAVRFGQMYVTVTAATATALTVTVPEGAPSGQVTVETQNGTATGPDFFWRNPLQQPSTVTTGRLEFGEELDPAAGYHALGIFDGEAGHEYAICAGGGAYVYGYATSWTYGNSQWPAGLVHTHHPASCASPTTFTTPYSGTFTVGGGYDSSVEVWECLDPECDPPGEGASVEGGAPDAELLEPAQRTPGVVTAVDPVVEQDAVERAGEDPEAAVVAGTIADPAGLPLEGVIVAAPSGESTITDEYGNFVLPGLDPSTDAVRVDGRGVRDGDAHHGYYTVAVELTAGHAMVFGAPLWLTPVDGEHAVSVTSPTIDEVVLTHPDVPGLEVRIPAGVTLKDHEYRTVENLVLVPVSVDRPPFPLPGGEPMSSAYFTVQSAGDHPTGGVYLSGGLAQVAYPNTAGAPPGTPAELRSYYADQGWQDYGRAEVTADGTQIRPLDGAGVANFDGSLAYGAWWLGAFGFLLNDDPSDGDPVNLRTGALTFDQTDLALSGEPNLAIDRTYNSSNSRLESLGVGWFFAYDMYLSNGDGRKQLNLGGGRLEFEDHDGEWVHTATPGEWYGARLYGVGNGTDSVWEHIVRRDGMEFWFNQGGMLTSIIDPNGNSVAVVRGPGAETGFYSVVERIISSSGRWLEIDYINGSGGSSCPYNEEFQVRCRISAIRDNLGREVAYTYDGSYRLETVTDAAGNVTSYGYDGNGRLATIEDGTEVVWLTNTYNGSGKVTAQTMPGPDSENPLTYGFAYDTDGGGQPRTTVTDPSGVVRQVVFDDDDHVATDTWAVGLAAETTTSYVTDPDTGRIDEIEVVDGEYPSGRVTSFVYDPDETVFDPSDTESTPDDMELVSVTEEGASTDYTTSYDYGTYLYGLPRSETLPGGFTWLYDYDSRGNLIEVEDPDGLVTTIDNNDQGFPVAAQTGTLDEATSDWDHGVLVGGADPSGVGFSRIADGAGRTLVEIGSAGERTTFGWDDANRLTTATDAAGGVSEFAYGLHGLTSFTDPAENVTAWSYEENLGVVDGETDPFAESSTETFRDDGLLECVTSRAGRSTKYEYDATGRLEFERFGTSGCGGSFASSIEYNYDGASRVESLVDSANGTVTYAYDEFDQVTSVTDPNGTVTYTWDDTTGRLDESDASGQDAVAYTWTDANYLDAVSWGTASHDYVWDANGQLDKVVRPSGVTVDFTRADNGQVTDIGWIYGGNPVAGWDTTYGYNDAGLLSDVGGGTRFSHAMPDEVTETDYDQTRLTSWDGGPTISYDDDGNVTSDGAATYSWNARGELAGIDTSGDDSSFGYDGLGRRTDRTVGSTAEQFLHAGDTVTQTQNSSGTPTADFLSVGQDGWLMSKTSTLTEELYSDQVGSVYLSTAYLLTSQVNTYEPFGAVTTAELSGAVNDFKFAGLAQEPSGLVHMRARYYQPEWGRFISEDPWGLAGGPHPYAYAGNNPINATDPNGTVVNLAVGCAVGAATDVAIGWGIAKMTGRKYGWRDAAKDGAIGCATGALTAGIGNVLSKGRKIPQGLGAADDIGRGTDDAARAADDVLPACRISSFVAGTQVVMADGTTKPIEDVALGDRVWATDPQTGESGPRPVTALITGTGTKELVDVTLEGGGTLTATNHHPFWVQSQRRWVDAQDLQAGDQLTGAFTTIAAATEQADATRTVHNLAIDDTPTYWILPEGDTEPVLVHNCPAGGHRKNKRPSNTPKHEGGDQRRAVDKGGEKADDKRPYSKHGNPSKNTPKKPKRQPGDPHVDKYEEMRPQPPEVE